MIIHSEDGLKYEVQLSIKTIQTTQHVITSDQLNTTGAELVPAQPQLVYILAVEVLLIRISNTKFIEGITYTTKESMSEILQMTLQFLLKKTQNI